VFSTPSLTEYDVTRDMLGASAIYDMHVQGSVSSFSLAPGSFGLC
jgi:hypothetical protein